jgi:hypothetical protein
MPKLEKSLIPETAPAPLRNPCRVPGCRNAAEFRRTSADTVCRECVPNLAPEEKRGLEVIYPEKRVKT